VSAPPRAAAASSDYRGRGSGFGDRRAFLKPEALGLNANIGFGICRLTVTSQKEGRCYGASDS
jgi:hypothetical protein